jgi:Icc-related predicted phosphoesterase
MRCWVFSDLHVDAAGFELPPTPVDVDIIILAGDLADGHDRGVRWLREQVVPLGLPVVMVLGNHDYYADDLDDDRFALYDALGVHMLRIDRPSVVIEGVRFIGQTLWTDYAIAGDIDAARSWGRLLMPDIMAIDVGFRRLQTRDLLERHRQQRNILERELAVPFAGKTVVVTHHAPHPKSLASPILTPSDGSFASDLTAIIETNRPALWVHGHVHSSLDYSVGGTRVVCNARGYARVSKDGRRLENRHFNPSLVVEI